MTTSASTYFPTNTYSVEDKSVLRIGGEEYETMLTYHLYVEAAEDQQYEVVINRTNFKVNQQKIDTVFLEMANQYMDALFPLQCTIENHRLKVVNLSEIKKRIHAEEKKISDKYSGEGVEHIRTQFLNATEDEDQLEEFIKQLHFMKILNLGMQKFQKSQNYFIKWNIIPINFSEWKGSIDYSKDKNELTFEPKIDNAQEIMDEVIGYIHKHEYFVDFEEENIPLYADFQQKIKYTGKTGRIKKGETNICIDVEDKFYYQQNLTFQTK